MSKQISEVRKAWKQSDREVGRKEEKDWQVYTSRESSPSIGTLTEGLLMLGLTLKK